MKKYFHSKNGLSSAETIGMLVGFYAADKDIKRDFLEMFDNAIATFQALPMSLTLLSRTTGFSPEDLGALEIQTAIARMKWISETVRKA